MESAEVFIWAFVLSHPLELRLCIRRIIVAH